MHYDMPLQMAAADVVIARAGAMTLSELARLGKAAILIPSPNVADNHQFLNAKTLADAGAALMIEEKEISTELLSENLFRILHDGAFAASLRQSILGFAHPDAADEILKDLQSLCQK